MRTILFFLLALFICTFTYAMEVTLQTVSWEGKPAYMLLIEGINYQNNALQLKFKLSATISQPIEIEKSTSESYQLKIGPISDYLVAKDLEKQLSNYLANQPNKSQAQIQAAALSADNTVKTNKKIWNLRNADIRTVIAEVSRVTGKNFVIDPRVQGKISIVSATPMANKAVYQVFLSMLQVSGYAAIPSGEVIKIVPNIDAKAQATDLLSQMKHPPMGEEIMVAVVPVHYVPAEQLVPVLRPLMPQWSTISAYPPSNMLILSGRANNIKQLSTVIKQVDSSSVNGIDVINLQYALAMDVTNTLKDLIKLHPGNYNPPMIAVDDRSNAILLSGNKTDRIRLRLLIAKLDSPNVRGNNSNTQVIYLNYLRAEDLVPILAGIAQANFSGNVGTTIGSITRPPLDSTDPAANLVNIASGNSQSKGQANAAATPETTSTSTQNEGSTKPTVQIIAEPNTNSIILNAPTALIRILKTVIQQLDIRPAQLLIEALVAEVNESDVVGLGIEWGTKQQTSKASFFTPGFAIINSKTSINDFQAQIYALARQQKANILSTPSVVVLDNRQAKILVGKQVSVASTTYPNNGNGTTPASPYTTFDRMNVALHLYVRPQITRGEGIQLQIDQGNDTLDPAHSLINNTTNPTFNISSIVTSVHVESGDIVVLGGLTHDALGNDNNKIPIIGDIPGIGRLFQHNIRNREKRVLMVFIRPIILRDEKAALQVSGSKYNNIRQYELDWLRSQEVYLKNENVTLPALNTATLPKPFSTPPELLMTK